MSQQKLLRHSSIFLISLTQLVGKMHNISKVWSSNLNHHEKKALFEFFLKKKLYLHIFIITRLSSYTCHTKKKLYCHFLFDQTKRQRQTLFFLLILSPNNILSLIFLSLKKKLLYISSFAQNKTLSFKILSTLIFLSSN